MLYEDVFRALNRKRIKYAIAGGAAVLLHGFVRFTADLDLIVAISRENLGKFFDTLYNLGYRPKVPVKKEEFMDKAKRKEWIEQRGMIVFSFFHLKEHLRLIDVFVEEPIKFSEIEKKIKKFRLKNISVPVLGIEHLKELKRRAGRPQDLIDIKNLEELERIKNERAKKS